MRATLSHRSLLLVALALAAALGCDVIAPPPPPPPPPEPGWYLSTPFPDVRVLNDVIVFEQFDPADGTRLTPIGYAVGSDGVILRLANETWTVEESGTDVDLQSIDGFIDGQGNEILFIVGFDGTVLRRAAETWELIPSGTTTVLFDVDVRDIDDAFIVGDAGTILRWDGLVLTPHIDHTLQEVVGGACPPPPNGCGADSVCELDGLCHSFFAIPEPLHGVAELDGRMYVVGARGAVYTYDPNGDPSGAPGNRWTREDSGTQRTLPSIYTEAGALVPTTDGVLMQRVDNGEEIWDDDSFRTPAPVFLRDVFVAGEGTFLVGLSEDIYHLDQNGEFQLTTIADEAELRGVDGVRVPVSAERAEDEGIDQILEVYVVGGGGRIARGPVSLPLDGAGETLLPTRVADEDFVE